MDPDKNLNFFNYTLASKTLDDMSLDTFLNCNPVPTVDRYPNIQSFLSSFRALNERLYSEAKQKFSNTVENGSEEDSEACPLKQNYLTLVEVLTNIKNLEKNQKDKNQKSGDLLENEINLIPSSLKKKLRRSAVKYCHSQALMRLFQGYHALCTYHKRTYNSYPEVFDKYLKTITTVFCSLSKNKIKNLFKEISSSQKTLDFYINLYSEWESVVNEQERTYFLNEL